MQPTENASNTPPVICVIQPKGGVGKTTLSFCLARYAAQYHMLRVLLIDTDKSANLSSLFLDPGQGNDNDHLQRVFSPAPDAPAPAPIHVYETPEEYNQGSIGLLPQFGDVSFLDSSTNFPLLMRLPRWISSQDFDIAIIDTPGWLGNVTFSALLSSTHYVCPIAHDPFSLQELPSIREMIQNIDQMPIPGKPLTDLGLLPYAVHPRSVRYRDFRSEITAKGLKPKLFHPDLCIESRISVTRCMAAKTPPWDFRPKAPGQREAARNYRKVLGHLLQSAGLPAPHRHAS